MQRLRIETMHCWDLETLACQKWLGNCTKVLGIGMTPTPPFGKISQKMPFFLELYIRMWNIKLNLTITGDGHSHHAGLWVSGIWLVCIQISNINRFSNKKLCTFHFCKNMSLIFEKNPNTRCPIKSKQGEPVHNACFYWNVALTLITGILVNGQ